MGGRFSFEKRSLLSALLFTKDVIASLQELSMGANYNGINQIKGVDFYTHSRQGGLLADIVLAKAKESEIAGHMMELQINNGRVPFAVYAGQRAKCNIKTSYDSLEGLTPQILLTDKDLYTSRERDPRSGKEVLEVKYKNIGEQGHRSDPYLILFCRDKKGVTVEASDAQKRVLVKYHKLSKKIYSAKMEAKGEFLSGGVDMLSLVDIYRSKTPTIDLTGDLPFRPDSLESDHEIYPFHPVRYPSQSVTNTIMTTPISISVAKYLNAAKAAEGKNSDSKLHHVKIIYDGSRFDSPPVTFSDASKVAMEGGNLVVESKQGKLAVDFKKRVLANSRVLDYDISHDQKKTFRDTHNFRTRQGVPGARVANADYRDEGFEKTGVWL